MDVIKRCSKCKMDCFKTIFQKGKSNKDVLQPRYIYCRIRNYNENRERTRKYYLEKRGKIKSYKKQIRGKKYL